MNESDVICNYLENLICLTVYEKWNLNYKHMFDGYQSDKGYSDMNQVSL